MANPLRTYQSNGQTAVHHRLDQAVTLEGYDRLRRLMKRDPLLGGPWRDALQGLVEEGEQRGKAGAPVHSGDYMAGRVTRGPRKGKMRSKRQPGKLKKNVRIGMHRAAFPMWGAVRSRGVSPRSASAPKGYPYPRLLNYSPRNKHVGWFDRSVIEPIVGKAELALSEAADKIAREWERG